MDNLIAIDDYSPVIKLVTQNSEQALPCPLVFEGKPSLDGTVLSASDMNGSLQDLELITSPNSKDLYLNHLYPTSPIRRMRLYKAIKGEFKGIKSILACGVPYQALYPVSGDFKAVHDAVKENIVKSFQVDTEEQVLPFTDVIVYPIEYAPFYDVALSNQRKDLPLVGKVYFIDMMERKTTISMIENGTFAKRSDGQGAVETLPIGTDVFREYYSIEQIEESVPNDIKDEFFSYLLRLLSLHFELTSEERIYWSGVGAIIFENQIKSDSNNQIIDNPEFSKVRGLYKFAKQKISRIP